MLGLVQEQLTGSIWTSSVGALRRINFPQSPSLYRRVTQSVYIIHPGSPNSLSAAILTKKMESYEFLDCILCKQRPWLSAALCEVPLSTCFIVLTVLSLGAQWEKGLEIAWNAFQFLLSLSRPWVCEGFPLWLWPAPLAQALLCVCVGSLTGIYVIFAFNTHHNSSLWPQGQTSCPLTRSGRM